MRNRLVGEEKLSERGESSSPAKPRNRRRSLLARGSLGEATKKNSKNAATDETNPSTRELKKTFGPKLWAAKKNEESSRPSCGCVLLRQLVWQ